MGTHPEITNPELRAILANEIKISYRLWRKGIYDDDAFLWLRVGLFTFARRVQFTMDNPQ